MIAFEEAYGIVLRSGGYTLQETVPFHDCSGRILDEDVLSDIDMPPFNRSAMDGYACRLSDLKNDLDVVEVIAAGKEPRVKVGKNQCSKIMTGAIVPGDCDVVFKVEESEILPDGRVRFTGTDPKVNISVKGEDVRKGDVVLRKPKLLLPQDIAILASFGHTLVQVKKKPVVGFISTGDELVSPFDVPEISQIRNSNAYQLRAQISRAGGEGIDYGIVRDNEILMYEVVVRAINECDIVLVSGGVSMGDFDFVPSVLKRADVNILFDRVNVQPGKPTTFGIHPDALVFGLPGNPVSSFIQFELLIRPLINKMMGYIWMPVEYKLPMADDFERNSASRLSFIPVTINKNMEVVPVDYHGSAHISALSYSDGIIAVKPGIQILKKGEIVNVRQI
jgi:molybdopterin molybdotransferase